MELASVKQCSEYLGDLLLLDARDVVLYYDLVLLRLKLLYLDVYVRMMTIESSVGTRIQSISG